MKKILIILAMCLTLIIPSAFASDEAEDDSLLKLKVFGIIEDGENITAPLTRAELAKYVLRLAAIDPKSVPASGGGFADVDSSHPDFEYISAINTMGWMRGAGDGNFNPEGEADIAMLSKLMLCITGYEPMADAKGGYPTGYTSVALGLGLFDGFAGGSDSLTILDAVPVFLNTLQTAVMKTTGYSTNGIDYDIKEGLTLLEDRHDIYIIKALLESDEYSSIYGMPAVGEGQLKIGGIVLNGKSDYLGYRVECYYREDSYGNCNALYIAPTDNRKIISVDSDDIAGDSVRTDKFVYTHKNAVETVELNAVPYL